MSVEHEQHVEVAARWMIHQAFEAWTEEAWGNSMPDIGQLDFDLIVERASMLLPTDVTLDEYRTTYTWFSDRAKKEHHP